MRICHLGGHDRGPVLEARENKDAVLSLAACYQILQVSPSWLHFFRRTIFAHDLVSASVGEQGLLQSLSTPPVRASGVTGVPNALRR